MTCQECKDTGEVRVQYGFYSIPSPCPVCKNAPRMWFEPTDNEKASRRVRRQLSDLDEALRIFQQKQTSIKTERLHPEDQIAEKRLAVKLATENFCTQFSNGLFTNNNELLYHAIENLHSLVVEAKRG